MEICWVSCLHLTSGVMIPECCYNIMCLS